MIQLVSCNLLFSISSRFLTNISFLDWRTLIKFVSLDSVCAHRRNNFHFRCVTLCDSHSFRWRSGRILWLHFLPPMPRRFIMVAQCSQNSFDSQFGFTVWIHSLESHFRFTFSSRHSRYASAGQFGS